MNANEQPKGLTDRPTGELVILIFAALIAAVVLLAGGGIFILTLLEPERDQSVAALALGNSVAGLSGAVLGYLAGRGRTPRVIMKDRNDKGMDDG